MNNLINRDKRITGKSKIRLFVKKNASGWLFLLPTVLILYTMVWRPTVMAGVWSLFKMRAYTIGEFIGLNNYKMVISHSQFVPILINTLKYVFWSLIIGFIPPVVLAIMINEVVYFKSASKIILYLPTIVPGIVCMIMWTYIYSPEPTGLLNMLLSKVGCGSFGWLNNPDFTIVGIIIMKTWKGLGGAMLLYYAGLQNVNSELYEAAVLDGAGMWKRAWNVTRPALAATLVLNFVNQINAVFQTLDEPLTMTGGGPNGASATLAYQLFQYGFRSGGKSTGQAMALGVIIFAILIVLTIFYFHVNKKIEENY